MSVGLYRGTVILEKHNPEWEILAKEATTLLKNTLKDVAVDIQHVGSTAIKDIYAKPIIDIVIGVNDLSKIFALNNELEREGFLFRGEDHPNQYLYICGVGDFITHHIHVTIYGSETWDNYINMRDYLNCHKEVAQEYSKLKLSLAEKYSNDRKQYTSMKSEMINEILLKAKVWRKELND